VPCLAHNDDVIASAVNYIDQAFEVIAQGIRNNDVEIRVKGPLVKPVFRKFN
jgi:hypothetical protein